MAYAISTDLSANEIRAERLPRRPPALAFQPAVPIREHSGFGHGSAFVKLTMYVVNQALELVRPLRHSVSFT